MASAKQTLTLKIVIDKESYAEVEGKLLRLNRLWGRGDFRTLARAVWFSLGFVTGALLLSVALAGVTS